MSDEHQTQPDGALVPPPRNPPVALATIDPPPPPPPRETRVARSGGLLRLLDAALDALDAVGDRVATAAGLR